MLDIADEAPLEAQQQQPPAPVVVERRPALGFGFGIMDLIVVTKLTWDLYKSCRDSSEDFKRLSTEVGTLHVVLKETEDYVTENPDKMDSERKRRLAVLTNGCKATLEDLQRLVLNYESLGTHAQRTWDRMRWGLSDISDVRKRLISNATSLGAFASSLAKYV